MSLVRRDEPIGLRPHVRNQCRDTADDPVGQSAIQVLSQQASEYVSSAYDVSILVASQVVMRIICAEPNEIPINQDLLGTIDLNLADTVSVLVPENVNAFHEPYTPIARQDRAVDRILNTGTSAASDSGDVAVH